jgi:hypothetical protein
LAEGSALAANILFALLRSTQSVAVCHRVVESGWSESPNLLVDAADQA